MCFAGIALAAPWLAPYDEGAILTDDSFVSPGEDVLLGGDYLGRDLASRYPRQLSGGERQRVNLARALAAEPKLLVCDEITSALDTVVAQAILDLLRDLQERLDVGYLFITHDISTVARVADTIAVMQNGEVVEFGSTGAVLRPPHHPYTELLLKSVPDMRTDWLDTLEPLRPAGSSER